MEPRENSPTDNPPSHPHRWAGLGKRIVSAAALGAIAFICLWQGGVAFSAFIMLVAMVMKKEWDMLGTQSPFMRAGGYIYIILPCASLLWLRNLPAGVALLATATLIVIVTATDIVAYFVGKSFGRRLLAPSISPGKTWEGLAGGVIAALIAAMLLLPLLPLSHSSAWALGLGPFVALLAQAGDLFESSLKRKAGVKDSGTLLPGHGGLLDRFDGYMFAAPVFALFIHFALAL